MEMLSFENSRLAGGVRFPETDLFWKTDDLT